MCLRLTPEVGLDVQNIQGYGLGAICFCSIVVPEFELSHGSVGIGEAAWLQSNALSVVLFGFGIVPLLKGFVASVFPELSIARFWN